ncbi:MAG: DCC1-like thiol-disulfide oxidoreductase family protein [Actinomycetota bacterium]
MAGTAATSEAALASTRSLTVLYDERCRFCRRCRDWLLTQPCRVAVELLPAGSEEARRRYGDVPWLRNELVVVDDAGRVWAGPAAFLVCLWATAKYRPWAFVLARPRLSPYTSRFFRFVSARRDRLSTWFGKDDPDCSWCDELRADWGGD